MKTVLIIFSFISFTRAETIKIEKINTASKKNGVSIKIYTDNFVNESQVTGWFNESTFWYYMTLHKVDGNISLLEKTSFKKPVTDIEIIKTGESIQLGFKMDRRIEESELHYIYNPSHIMASLRFPLIDVIASMETDRTNKFTNKDVKILKTKKVKRLIMTAFSGFLIFVLSLKV